MFDLARSIVRRFAPSSGYTEDGDKPKRLKLKDPAGWSWWGGGASQSGKLVTMDTTLKLSAAWACVKVNAQAVASLPLSIYQKGTDDSRKKITDDNARLAEVLTENPNQDQTALEFWECVTAWQLVRGNAYAEISTSGFGSSQRLVALQPLNGNHTWPHRNPDGQLVYRINDRGKVEELPREKVFHVKGFGQSLKNPDMGLSPIEYGVDSLGAALSSQDAASATFSKGLRPSGVLTLDQQLDPDQRKMVRENIVKPMVESRDPSGIAVLEAGMKWEAISFNPDDAQMLETRRFDVEEICRWFGTPPIIVGHSAEGQTMWGSGVEQILISWLTLGLDPICDRIEARIKKQLIRPLGLRNVYAEFNREAILQMDSKAKGEFLSKAVTNGIMDRNEARAKLNLPAREGADQLTAQVNLAPLDQLGGSSDAGNQARQALRAWLMPDEKGPEHDET